MNKLEQIKAIMTISRINDGGDEVDAASAQFSQWLDPMVNFDNWGNDEFGNEDYVLERLNQSGSVWGYIFSQYNRIKKNNTDMETAVSRVKSMFGDKVAEIASKFLSLLSDGKIWIDAFYTLKSEEITIVVEDTVQERAFGKAIKTETNWVIAFADDDTMRYEIGFDEIGVVPHSFEPYDSIKELIAAMEKVAPISEWSEELYNDIVE